MAENRLKLAAPLDLQTQEIINALNVIPAYKVGQAYVAGAQVINDGLLYTFNEAVSESENVSFDFAEDMLTEAGTAEGVKVGSALLKENGTVGELFSLTEEFDGDGTTYPAGLYRRATQASEFTDWVNISQTATVTKGSVDTAIGAASAADGSYYGKNGIFSVPPNDNTTYQLTEDTTEGSSDLGNLQLKATGDNTALSNIPLGARTATFIPGSTDEQGIFLSLERNGVGLPSGSAEFVNTVTSHGEIHVEESPYLDWEVAGGRGALNSTGLHERFDDTYRKNEIETWVENDIPVNSKQAIQYYEVQGRPNRDETATAGALSSEDIEFSQFEVDLGLQRRTGFVSDYISKAISFTVTAAESVANQGHWTVAVGANATIFVIKDSVYKEFKLVDSASGGVTDLHLRCAAYDPLSISGAHNNQYIRIGASQGTMFNFLLSELNKDPNVEKGISSRRSITGFPNEDVTAIQVGYHSNSSNQMVQTIAYGTSEGHISYYSVHPASLNNTDDYITDHFDAQSVTLTTPSNLRFPAASHATLAYPAGVTKNHVWVRDIKWIGQAGEFIAVGNHQDAIDQSFDPPGSELGGPLVAYFKNIQGTSGSSNLIDGQLNYLTTPFREEFFDNLYGSLGGVTRPLSYEPTEGDGSRVPTLDQVFETGFSSVVPVSVTSGVNTGDWVYLFGTRQDRRTSAHTRRAFCIKARLTGGQSINEAVDEHIANPLQPIQGGIDWHLVNQISEITDTTAQWANAGTETLSPLNHAQARYEVRGGALVSGLSDANIIDIFGDNRIVVDLNATTDALTNTQDAEDGLSHQTNGWQPTDDIHGGWIGNVKETDIPSDETEGFQTLTILGQSQGTTPLYGISKYVADITVTLKPINVAGDSTDPDIVLGPIRVPSAKGELLRTNFLNRLAAEFNTPDAGVMQNAPANETATVSSYDATYGVATISFASDTRDFDISVTTPDIHQIVNFDNDGYEFVLRFSQEFIAGEGQEIFVLAHPRLPNDLAGDAISPDDQVTLLTSNTDDTPLAGNYNILFTVDGLELQVSETGTGNGLPFGTVVQVTYGYNTPSFYQFIHNQATSIVVHDPYHGGSGTIHVPVGMAFADDNALVSYLTDKLSDLFEATNIDVLQEGNSSVIEFRSTLRGDQPGDLILDDDQKIMIEVTNPATNLNLENVGGLQINRLFNGDTDFPGKFPSTFNFDDALTETDLRSVLHQVFANVGSVGGLNVPVTTAVGDETSVINSANESLYEDNRIVTESHIAEQVVSKHVAGTESSAFTGSVNFVDGSFVDATGVTLDLTGSDVHGLDEHIQIARGSHTFNSIDNIFYTAESTTVDGTTSIGFATHADYLEFLTEIGLPTVGTGIIQVTAGFDVTLNITRTTGNIDETFTIPSDVRYYYVDPQNAGSRIIFFYNEDVSGLPGADIGNATLEVSIPNSTVGVTNLDATGDIDITVVGDTATFTYTGSASGLTSVNTDATITGLGTSASPLSIATTALGTDAIHLGGLTTDLQTGSVPFYNGSAWILNNRIGGTDVLDASTATMVGVAQGDIVWVSPTQQYVNNTSAGQTVNVNTDFTTDSGWLRLGDGGGGISVIDVSTTAASIPNGSIAWVSDIMQYVNNTGNQVAGVDADHNFTGWLQLGDGGASGTASLTGNNTFTGENLFVVEDIKGFEIADYSNDSDQGPELVIDRKRQSSANTNAVAADGDNLGVVRFQGNSDSAATNVNYATIGSNIIEATDGEPVGQVYIKVADGSQAGGGSAGNHIKVTGESKGGATITTAADTTLEIDGDITIKGVLTAAEGSQFNADNLHVLSGDGHQFRSDAPTVINGALTGSGFTTAIDNLLDIRGGGVYGIRTAGGLSIVSTDTTANTITLASNQTLAQGEISIPGQAGVLTATGDQDNITRFLARASQISYYNLADGSANTSAPIALVGHLRNSVPVGTSASFLLTGAKSGTGGTATTWAGGAGIIFYGNPGNISHQNWEVGDNIFIYQDPQNYGVYTVELVSGSTGNWVDLSFVSGHGVPDISDTGTDNGKETTVVSTLKTIELVTPGTTGPYQYTDQFDFDPADGLRFRDNLDDLTITGIFDLTDSGLTTSDGNITASGNLNKAPVNAMAYLAIQLNSFNVAELTAGGAITQTGSTVGLSTGYVSESVTIGGSAAVYEITYQALLNASAAADGGVPTSFTDYTYVVYQSVYDGRSAAVFLDRIDGNGTTFTTHSFAQGGTTGTLQTVVVPQQ